MQPDNLPISTILTRVRESRQQFDAILARFNDDQMTVTHDPDGWSLQDVMAHITFWESYALTRLQQATHGRTPELYGDVSEDQINAINQGALDAGRAKSLDQIKEEFARIHRDLLDAIRAIPTDEDDPWWDLWPEPHVPKRLIMYNTWDHYAEHLETVRTWLGPESQP
jgi:hypothetical protein